MKRILTLAISFIALLCTGTIHAQDLSTQEAVKRINESATRAVKAGHQVIDETGEFQYVDAEIKSVHNYNDYSYGSMLSQFESLLEKREALANPFASSSIWPEDRRNISKENRRMLEYVQENMTRIVGYSAVVDYVGISKFGERKEASTVLCFDSQGTYINPLVDDLEVFFVEFIGVTDPDYTHRKDIKDQLVPYMFKQVVSELTEMQDPLFLLSEYWTSEKLVDAGSSVSIESQCCYRLTKENTGDSAIDKGHFRAFFYQHIIGSSMFNDNLLVVNGTYEKDASHISFSYGDADVTSYIIRREVADKFQPGSLSYIDYRNVSTPRLQPSKPKKTVHEFETASIEYTWVDENSFKMRVPMMNERPLLFTKL